MEVYTVKYNSAEWVFRQDGAVFEIRKEFSREQIVSFVEEYMMGRTGSVIFHTSCGLVDVKKDYLRERAAKTVKHPT